MKKIISMLIAVLMLASVIAVPTFASMEFVFPDETWGENENGEFLIADAADLLAFSASAQMNNYYTGKTVKLTADIDMTNIEWLPVTNFKGTFDGDGHAIKGVTLAGQDGRIGFFTQITSATIQNVRFLDFNVSLASTSAKSASIVAAYANHECLIKNVYTSGVAATAGTIAAGMVGYVNTQNTGVLRFENCVSAVKCVGARAGGFVGQIHPLTTVEFTDCAFIGDLSEAGKWSSGFTGLTVGVAKLTRCVSLANIASTKSKEIGSLVFLDHQNNTQAQAAKSEILIEDCYAATADGYYAVGVCTSRGWPFKLTIKNGGETKFYLESSENATLPDNRDAIESATNYIAKGATVNITKDDFSTKLAVLEGWEATGTTVEYAEGFTVDVIVPASVKVLMEKTFEAAPLEPSTPDQPTPDDNGTTDDSKSEDKTENKPEDKNDAATEAPKDTQAVTAEPADKGCSGSMGISAIAVFALAGGAVAIARKKKED